MTAIAIAIDDVSAAGMTTSIGKSANLCTISLLLRTGGTMQYDDRSISSPRAVHLSLYSPTLHRHPLQAADSTIKMMPIAFYAPPQHHVPLKPPTPAVPTAAAPTPISAAPLAPLTPLTTLLRHPSDLQKLPLIRKKLVKERHAISTTLNAGVSSQLAATREGLRSLVMARDEVAQLREQLKSLDRKDGTQGGEIEALARIGQVSKIARQIAQTVEIVTQLREMTSTVTRIADLFESDASTPYGSCPHLLEVHAQLLRLTAFRAEAIHDARPADRLVLLDLFKALDELAKRFEDWLFGAVVAEVVEWVRRGRGGVVVRVWKVVEVEGKEDEKVSYVRCAIPGNRERGGVEGSVKTSNRGERLHLAVSSYHWIHEPQMVNHHDRTVRLWSTITCLSDQRIVQTFQ